MIYKVALTGGVCAGKTTCLDVVKNEFIGLGYKVFIVNEQATQVINNGFTHELLNEYDDADTIGYTWQQMNTQSQLNIEDFYTNTAKLIKEDVIILCDRGILDGKSFETSKVWNKVLDSLDLTDEAILERYDSVIFLESVAKDRPELYTLDNNTARRETVEQAVINNDRLLNVYKDHPKLHIVDNSTGFEAKIGRVINYIKKDIREKRYLNTINQDNIDFDM